MIDVREQIRKGDDGSDGPGWLALGAGLGWMTVGLLVGALALSARLGAWAVETKAATDCHTAEAMAAMAERRAVVLDTCPELVPLSLGSLLGLEAGE